MTVENSVKDRYYRVNPFCPSCGEEHAYYTICITGDEQKKVDEFYEEKKYNSTLESLFGPCPLFIEKEFQCPVCKVVFVAKVGIRREINVNFHSKDCILMGVHPVF